MATIYGHNGHTYGAGLGLDWGYRPDLCYSFYFE